MTAIMQALSSGYSAKQILKYLSQHNPQLANQINTALNAGHTLDHILNFLSKHEKKMGNLVPNQQQSRSDNLYKTAQTELHPALKGMAQTGGMLAAGMGGYALARALPQIVTQGALQSNILPTGQLPPMTPSSPTGINAISALQQVPQSSQAQLQSQQPPNLNAPSNIPQNAPTQQHEIISSKSDVLWNSLNTGKAKGFDPDSDALMKIAQKMRTTGEISSKEDFDKLYQLFEQKKASGMSLPKALKEASNEYDKMKMSPETQTQVMPEQEKPIAKSEMVASPHGVGEVKEIRGDKALVDIDGKLHKVNKDELIQSPIPEKELADLYDEMIAGIEKQTGQQVSRNVEWAGYDPINNELAYKPHGSDKLYLYDEIPKEDVDLLTSLMTKRKSTGENFIGAWEAGTTSPIGAAMYQLIQRLQKERGGKGKEYRSKFETIYDAIEPAKLAAKKRHAERKRKAKKPRID